MKYVMIILMILITSIANATMTTSRTYNIDQESLVIEFSGEPFVENSGGAIKYGCPNRGTTKITFSKIGMKTSSFILEPYSIIIFDPSTGWLTIVEKDTK